MSKRDDLLVSVAETIADYRIDEVAAPTPDHADRWIQQFERDVQVPVLRELDHVLDTTYFGRNDVDEFLGALVTNTKLTGASPETFWKSATFLDIQTNGESQRVFLSVFGECLARTFGIEVGDCGSPDGPFVYLDDILFSGARIGGDLSRWIVEEAPKNSTIHVIVIATHALGGWQVERRISEVAAAAGKTVALSIWRAVCFENRKAYRDESEVLWPVALPDDPLVQEYAAIEKKFPFEPRKPEGKLETPIFSSEDGRQLLEREFLISGTHIRAACREPSQLMRPLGFSSYGLGFGSMIVTFRNCPNNAPLALWWGDPEASVGSALDWYPLFPRKTYSESTDLDDLPF